MNVLVIGAHGATGQLTVEKLAERNHQVSGMIRDAAQAAVIRELGATPVVADLEQATTLPDAVAGQEAVIFAAGSKGKRLETVDKGGVIRVIDAARNAGTRRFVMLSSIWAGRPDEGPEKLRAYLHAKHEADEYLERSELDYTIARPGYLTNGPETGRIATAHYFGGEGGSISRADVAETLVTALEMQETIGQAFEIIAGGTPVRDALKGLR